jgi:acyl-CoA synthetase (AMP-forming)/AMP-acid ligase II
MLTEPGVDLICAIYGVWRAGGVTVVADRGLGVRGLGAAVRSARASWVIGPRRARWAASVLRWAPRATPLDIAELVAPDAASAPPVGRDLPDVDAGDPAAILFTSGATGPAKGVRYLHGQLGAQRDALAGTYRISDNDRLVAAFAPFALYGPALGVPTAIPACDVTRPAELTAALLDEACSAVGATMAFGSPAALANVVATAQRESKHPDLAKLRLVMSAGAPVPVETLEAVARLAPHASMRTPYGMTEVLPVADIGVAGVDPDPDSGMDDDARGGVCVGPPVDGASVRLLPVGFDVAAPARSVPVGELGEIVITAPWMSDGYLGLWKTQRDARPIIDGQAAVCLLY